MLLSSARRCGALLGRRADAEQLIEGQARIANHRQRLILVGPADGVGVDAGVAVRAAARLVDRFDAQLHRRDRRLLPELLRVDLVERDAGADVGALRLPRMRLRQEHRARAEVIAADFRQLERFGVAHVGVADDGQVVAEGFERRRAPSPTGRSPCRRPPATTGSSAGRTWSRPRSRAPSRWRRAAPCRPRSWRTRCAPAPSPRSSATPSSHPCRAAPCGEICASW